MRPATGRDLLRAVDELRHRTPSRAVRLAESACEMVAAEPRDGRWLALQAEAWAVLGSAYRATDELHRAEGAFNVALAFLSAAGPLPELERVVRPRLAQRASYLRSDQGRHSEALALNAEALAIYHASGETQRFAGALVDRAIFVRRAGSGQRAVALLAGALKILRPDAHRRSYRAAVHNMALYLHELATTRSETLAALAWLRAASTLHARRPENVHVLRLRLLEGATLVRLGRREAGIRLLWRVSEGFRELGLHYEHALVLLRLADISLQTGRADQVKRLAGWLFPLLGRPEVDRPARSALRRFYQAAQQETATPGLVAGVSQRVASARRATRLG